jgi:hypothetical protein
LVALIPRPNGAGHPLLTATTATPEKSINIQKKQIKKRNLPVWNKKILLESCVSSIFVRGSYPITITKKRLKLSQKMLIHYF